MKLNIFFKKIIIPVILLFSIPGYSARIANTAGPGFSYMDRRDLASNIFLSVEITASAPQSESLRKTKYTDFFWIAAGLKYTYADNTNGDVLEKERSIYIPYGEVGFWLFATYGAGISRVYGYRSIKTVPHVYIGYPIVYKNEQKYFITPFYRRYFGDLDSNELGFFIKTFF